MLQTLLIVLSCVPALSVAQVTIDPVGAVTVVEGNNLTITCAEVGSPGSAMELRKDGVRLTGTDIPPNTITSSMRTYSLLVDRTANGNTYNCFSRLSTMFSEDIILTVFWNDPISVSVSNDSVLGATISITLNDNPTPIERIDGMTIPDKDARVTIGANTIVFQSLTSTDSGTYIVTFTNAAGNQTATFFLLHTPPTGELPTPTEAPATAIVGGTVGGLALIVIVGSIAGMVVFGVWWKKKKKRSHKDEEEEGD